jgi:predicted tellurium resistance membrane protein TerC
VHHLAWLLGSTLAAWAVAAYPAYRLGGDSALVFSTVAMAVCLLPAAATFLLARLAFHRSPEQQLLLILGGSGIRMAVVLVTVLVLNFGTEYFQSPAFAVWVLVFYLWTLTLEVTLLLQDRSAWEKPANQTQA